MRFRLPIKHMSICTKTQHQPVLHSVACLYCCSPRACRQGSPYTSLSAIPNPPSTWLHSHRATTPSRSCNRKNVILIRTIDPLRDSVQIYHAPATIWKDPLDPAPWTLRYITGSSPGNPSQEVQRSNGLASAQAHRSIGWCNCRNKRVQTYPDAGPALVARGKKRNLMLA